MISKSEYVFICLQDIYVASSVRLCPLLIFHLVLDFFLIGSLELFLYYRLSILQSFVAKSFLSLSFDFAVNGFCLVGFLRNFLLYSLYIAP